MGSGACGKRGVLQNNYNKKCYKTNHDTPPYKGLIRKLTIKIRIKRRLSLPDMFQILSDMLTFNALGVFYRGCFIKFFEALCKVGWI